MSGLMLKFYKRVFCFALPGLMENALAQAAEILKTGLTNAEKFFLQSNYGLIAKNEQNDRAVITIKIFDNPVLRAGYSYIPDDMTGR